jgi:hypothetical protein
VVPAPGRLGAGLGGRRAAPGAQITSLISYAHDVDFYAAWARLVVFDSSTRRPRRYAAGCAYLRGQGRGRIRGVRGLRRVLSELGPLVVEKKLPAIGAAPSSSYEGDGYVIVRHPDTTVVERALGHIVRRCGWISDDAHVLMLSPGYPAEMPYFTRALSRSARG